MNFWATAGFDEEHKEEEKIHQRQANYHNAIVDGVYSFRSEELHFSVLAVADERVKKPGKMDAREKNQSIEIIIKYIGKKEGKQIGMQS